VAIAADAAYRVHRVTHSAIDALVGLTTCRETAHPVFSSNQFQTTSHVVGKPRTIEKFPKELIRPLDSSTKQNMIEALRFSSAYRSIDA
jgi:hypothetical protein